MSAVCAELGLAPSVARAELELEYESGWPVHKIMLIRQFCRRWTQVVDRPEGVDPPPNDSLTERVLQALKSAREDRLKAEAVRRAKAAENA